jgi:hypothetical protein
MTLRPRANLAGRGLASHLGVLRAALEADPGVACGAVERHTLAESGGVVSEESFFCMPLFSTRVCSHKVCKAPRGIGSFINGYLTLSMEAAVSTTMLSSTAGVTRPVSPKVSRASAHRRPRGHLSHMRVLVRAAVLYHTRRSEVAATCVCWCALQCYITREVAATR